MSELPAAPARIEIESTDGMALRELVVDDAQRYFELIDYDRSYFKYGEEVTANNYPDVESVIRSITNPKNPDKERFGIWDGPVMVGSINLKPHRDGLEVGYWVGAEYKGHGYAKRAVELVTDYALSKPGVERLTAWVDTRNLASIKTLKRTGFRNTGFTRMDATGEKIFYELRPKEGEI